MTTPVHGDHLARLLTPTPGGEQSGIVTAYLMTWDAVTGANTVSVGATSYVNLSAIRAAVTGPGPVLILLTPEPLIVGSVSPVTTAPVDPPVDP